MLDPGLLEHESLAARREAAGPLRPGRRRRLALWVALGLFGWAAVSSLAGAGRAFNADGWPLLARFFAAAASPDLSLEFLVLTAESALITLSYAVLGTALSVVVGLAGGALASRTWWGRTRAPAPFAWMIARAGLGLPRGVHEAVWGLFLLSVLGLDPLVAVLAIGIPYGAMTAKVFAELIDERPQPAWSALRNAGAGRTKALFYSALPVSFPDLLSYAFYRFECSIRAAAILGVIGAGGLGFQLALSFQSLRYSQMWTLIYALAALSGAADLWSGRLRRRNAMRCMPRRLDPGGGPGASSGRPAGRDRFITASLLAGVALVAGAWVHLGMDPSTLVAPRTRGLLADMASRSLPPALGPGGLPALAGPALETVRMALIAGGLAFALAVPAAFLAARARASGRLRVRLARRAGAAAMRWVLLFARAIPPPVWALLFLFVAFPGPLPGALALAAYNFGILGRLMAESAENLDPGPGRAMQAAGASPAQTFAYAGLPRAIPRFAAFGLYRWEVAIRETVVVGMAGAGGLGRILTEQMAAFDYASALTTVGVLVVLAVAADFAGAAFSGALRKG